MNSIHKQADPWRRQTCKEATITNTNWEMPATTTKKDGEARHVGVEIELQGIPVQQLANVVRDAIGGSIHKISRSEFEVDVPDQGSYRIEVDYALLKELAREEADTQLDNNPSKELVIEALDTVSSILVPCEIVSPPIAMEALGEPMDAIVEAARAGGAKGTGVSIAYAFGVHLNIEPPDMQAGTILAYMKAFVCLFDWIAWAGKVDFSRRVTPYINPFPPDYRKLILAADYHPDFQKLISDYLEHNATRNRAMDMLPLFSSIDEKTIADAVDDDRVKARPAFHYRLENSCVDESGWSIENAWNRWLKIEQLANDQEALDELSSELLADAERALHSVDSQWRKRVHRWAETS